MTQVHKESLGAIENALPNRAGLEVEIFGMEGIPDDVTQSHNQRVIAQFSQAEADRRAATGNTAPGSSSANPAKKAKLESPSDLKKRLAEHKAKKAEEAAAASNNIEPTPMDPLGGQSPGFGQPPGYVSLASTPYISPLTEYQSGSSAGYGQPFAGPPVPGFNGFPQPYGQPAPTFQPPAAYGSPPGPSFGQQPQFAPPQPYQPPNSAAYAPPSQYQAGPPLAQPQNVPIRAFGANSPSVPFQVSPPPLQGASQPQRPSNLPAAPGLPQRPTFGAPPVSNFQMQQMHHGQIPGSSGLPFNEQQLLTYQNDGPPNAPPGDDGAQLSTQAPVGAVSNELKEDGKGGDAQPEKKAKKDKDKDVKLVYSDNEVSPEEKMAKLPRYAFDPKEREKTVLDEPAPAVTGVASGS
ncbi:MAG: hypothetical protein LQ340_005118 [Diploschistes diacapsis]|nr:MAG: hypothetical protein LQ340_005118 [Diploschistes diacapsis]